MALFSITACDALWCFRYKRDLLSEPTVAWQQSVWVNREAVSLRHCHFAISYFNIILYVVKCFIDMATNLLTRYELESVSWCLWVSQIVVWWSMWHMACSITIT